MLTPEEIERREFVTALHGYAKADVRAFLEEVAVQIGELVQNPPAPIEDLDEFESMGSQIAGVLRAAKDAAAALNAEADERLRTAIEQADERLATASRDAEELLAAAESIRTEAIDEAAQLRAEAERTLADAQRDSAAMRADAEQILASARQQAGHIQREAAERAEHELADARAGVQERLARLAGHEAAIRDRLLELADAVQDAHTVLSTNAPEHVGAESHV
jgi:DivIVA domain-containing protein